MRNHRLSNPLQINSLKFLFKRLNPDIETDLIDWEGVLNSRLTMDENVEAFKEEYPQYQWKENKGDPYFFQATEEIRRQADEYGLEVVKKGIITRLQDKNNKLEKENRGLKIKRVETKLYEPKTEPTIEINAEDQKYATVTNKIIEDCFRVLVVINSETGHGKSTSLQTIIADLKRKHPKTIVKVFDISQAWYHQAPLAHRQRITPEKIMRVDFSNKDDCVYEIGGLDKDLRRFFVALILKQDFDIRYNMGLKYGLQSVKNLPKIIYIFEEANCYFDSYSLRKNDDWSPVLNDFVSVGRNYGMRGFLVVTAEQGELSPGFRRRATGRLLGRVINEYDLSQICKGRVHLKDMFRKMPRFHWIYYHGSFSEMFRVGDKVRNVPKDFEVKRGSPKQPQVAESTPMNWGQIVIGILLIVILFLLLR